MKNTLLLVLTTLLFANILQSQNIGIGTSSPDRILEVSGTGQIQIGEGSVIPDLNSGLFWHSTTNYSIHRTSGAWNAPFSQLRLDWPTGVEIDPGTLYDKSYLNVQGNGIRVPSGTIGIGSTSAPTSLLHTFVNGAGTHITLERTDAFPSTYTIGNSGNHIIHNYTATGYRFQKDAVTYLEVNNAGIDVNGIIEIVGKRAFQGNDPWLRLNQNSDFTNGVYTPGFFRVDGGIASGNLPTPGGGNISASGNGSFGGTLTVTGVTTIGGRVNANGGISAAGSDNNFFTSSFGGHNWLPFTNGSNYFSADNHFFRANSNGGTMLTVNPDGIAVVGRITADGGGIGTSTYRLELPNTNNNRGRGYANNWVVASSIRYKENIKTIDNSITVVKQLDGKYYDYKPEFGGGRGIGFIAEDIMKILPELAEPDPSDTNFSRGIAYDGFIPILTQAIKEQQAMIEKLQFENKQSNSKLDNLESELAAIKELLKHSQLRAEK